MCEVIVHPRIHRKHPNITDEEVLFAWEHIIKWVHKLDTELADIVAIGVDSKARLMELIAVEDNDGYMIYHAFVPATDNIIREVGIPLR